MYPLRPSSDNDTMQNNVTSDALVLSQYFWGLNDTLEDNTKST